MFGKILLVMGLVAVALFMLRSALGKSKKPPASKPPEPTQPSAQRLVHCDRCGAHLAQSEAIWKAGRAYCCPEHVEP